MIRPAVLLASISSALLLSGCTVALVGNLVVLCVTVGIFVGTLGLGRARAAAEASRSGVDDVTQSQEIAQRR